jgi:uncharacterized protein YkwD
MAGQKIRRRPSLPPPTAASLCERFSEKNHPPAKIERHSRRFRVESTMRVISLALVGVVAALATATQGRAQYQQYPQYGATSQGYGRPDLRAAVGQIFSLANQARAQAGVASLKWDPALAVSALQHCRRMAAAGSISHQYRGEPDPAGRASQAGAHFSLIEENVAMAPSPAAVHQAWMQSPGHRENLLSPEVDHVGIAVVFDRGEFYAVADYSALVESLSPAQIEARVAALVRAGGASVLSDPTLARSACESDDDLLHAPAARPAWMIRWQDPDLSRLPRALTSQLRSGKYRKAAVGSCPPQEDDGTFTSYRVAVLLY